MGQLIEIRTYTLKAGSAAQFQQLMLEQSLPLLRAAGTDVVAARPSLHSAHAYVLIRAYASLAQCNESQQAFYSGAAWVEGPREAILACIEHYTSVVIAAGHAAIEDLREGALHANQ